jgi:translation elongation factor P/translation initiation factor 5A
VASTADFKNGLVLNIDGQLWTIIEFQHVKPGKGPAFVRTKLKNVLTGKVVDKTYNAGVKVETATVDRRDATYLYRDGSDFGVMDSQDYEQHPLPEARKTPVVVPTPPARRLPRASRSVSVMNAQPTVTVARPRSTKVAALAS